MPNIFTDLKIGDTIKLLRSEETFTIDKIFVDGHVDMTSTEKYKPELGLNWHQKFYSIKLENFEITNTTMDIGSTHGGLAAQLSNFQARKFMLELGSEFLPIEIKESLAFKESIEKVKNSLVISNGSFGIESASFEIECASLEGVLQALKFNKAHIAIEVCKLVGFAAKRRGSNRNKPWKSRQTLWFMGVAIPRNSDLMDRLHDFIYISCWIHNEKFRNDLKASGTAELRHSMGKSKKPDTVLTEQEFCSRLMKLRECNSIKDIKKIFKL